MSWDFDARFFDPEKPVPDNPYPQLSKIIKSARTGLARRSHEEMLSLYNTISDIIDRHILWQDADATDLVDAVDQEANEIKSFQAYEALYALALIYGGAIFLSSNEERRTDFILAAQKSIHAANMAHEADFRNVSAGGQPPF